MATVMPQSSDLGLTEFVDTYADNRLGRDLTSLGSRSLDVYKRIGDEEATRALLGTNFWRAWLSSDGAALALQSIGADPGVLDVGRIIIVPRRDLYRFDLVVLDSTLPPDFQPQMVQLSNLGLQPDELRRGATRAASAGTLPGIGQDANEVAVESFADGKQPYTVVLAAAPSRERLAIPDRILNVSDGVDASTAGVVVKETGTGGREGVTVALHAIQNASSVGATITVDGQNGTLVRSDSINDSAFVELPVTPSSGARTTKGVLRGLAPRGSQAAEFTGATSGLKGTTITGWDPQIPTPSSRRQACVYTGRDAQPGDSGAALIADDDYIVGFAFERSKPGRSPADCSWIWADSALTALGVELI